MKQGWEIKKLGEVCEITMGQSPSSNTYNDSEGLPFYQGNGDFGKVNPIARVYCNAPIRIAECNDILISVRAPIGAINIANCKCCIGRGLASIRSTKSLSYEFVYHALIANKEKLIAQGTGSTFKSIGRSILKELPIPVPPLPVQERIVSELDLLSGIIEKKREQLKELNALAQSIFYDMFGDPITNEKGWEVKKLKDVCIKLFAGGDVPKENYSETCTEEYNIPIYSNGIGDNALYGYTCIKKVEDVSITISGRGTIGYCEVRKAPFYPIIRLIVATPLISTVLPITLKYIIDNLDIKSTGGAIPQLTIPMIKDRFIPIPPLPLQHQFASKIEAIEKQKELIKQSISETETLFNARMQEHFG